jgi:hypothetical protein
MAWIAEIKLTGGGHAKVAVRGGFRGFLGAGEASLTATNEGPEQILYPEWPIDSAQQIM